MRKIGYYSIFLFVCSTMHSQIGINTSNPQEVFHIDGAKDNPTIGSPNAGQQVNDIVVTKQGRLGIGTISPISKMEINSDIINTSGLKFTNLNSTTPVLSGGTLGVDTVGNVVVVPKNIFSPAFGRIVLGTTVNIASGEANYNLMSFTLPTAGTYLVMYNIRGEIRVSGGNGWLVGFLSTDPSQGHVMTNSEVLITTSNDSSRSIVGGTGTGSLVVSVAQPTTYFVGIRSTGIAGVIYNNSDGRTSVNYVKITP